MVPAVFALSVPDVVDVNPVGYVTASVPVGTGVTVTEDTVMLLVPVLLTDMVMYWSGDVPAPKVMLVILSSSVPMNPTVNAPIHAATAMLTATVTAMSMIDATTGLRAFLLFLKFFISLFIPPLGLMSMLEEHTNLNLAT
jgi:hypothetical protein